MSALIDVFVTLTKTVRGVFDEGLAVESSGPGVSALAVPAVSELAVPAVESSVRASWRWAAVTGVEAASFDDNADADAVPRRREPYRRRSSRSISRSNARSSSAGRSVGAIA